MMKRSLAQTGVVLIEALLGILIFSIGILALVAMHAASISASADAQYRVEAVNLANQMLSEIWTNVNRATPAAFATSFASFSHNPNGTTCAFDPSGASTNAAVTAWAALINTGGVGGQPLLPGATAVMQQIVVTPTANNRVMITVCWKSPADPPNAVPHNHVLVAYVN